MSPPDATTLHDFETVDDEDGVTDADLEQLTPAEREVWDLAEEGWQPTMIGEKTDRSGSTARTLLQRARRKLGVTADE